MCLKFPLSFFLPILVYTQSVNVLLEIRSTFSILICKCANILFFIISHCILNTMCDGPSSTVTLLHTILLQTIYCSCDICHIAIDWVPNGITMTVAHYQKFILSVFHLQIENFSLKKLTVVGQYCTVMRASVLCNQLSIFIHWSRVGNTSPYTLLEACIRQRAVQSLRTSWMKRGMSLILLTCRIDIYSPFCPLSLL